MLYVIINVYLILSTPYNMYNMYDMYNINLSIYSILFSMTCRALVGRAHHKFSVPNCCLKLVWTSCKSKYQGDLKGWGGTMMKKLKVNTGIWKFLKWWTLKGKQGFYKDSIRQIGKYWKTKLGSASQLSTLNCKVSKIQKLRRIILQPISALSVALCLPNIAQFVPYLSDEVLCIIQELPCPNYWAATSPNQFQTNFKPSKRFPVQLKWNGVPSHLQQKIGQTN